MHVYFASFFRILVVFDALLGSKGVIYTCYILHNLSLGSFALTDTHPTHCVLLSVVLGSALNLCFGFWSNGYTFTADQH